MIKIKQIALAFIAIQCASALTPPEALKCIGNINSREICTSKPGCFDDFSKHCVQNNDHDSNKACKLLEDYRKSFNNRDLLTTQENGQTSYITPDELKKRVDKHYPLNNEIVTQAFNTWFEIYKTAHAEWVKQPYNSSVKSDVGAALDKFYSDDFLYLYEEKAQFRPDIQIAHLECLSDCAKRVTNKHTKYLQSQKIKCYGDRPAGKSIDGSTSNLEQGATNDKIIGAVVEKPTDEAVFSVYLLYNAMILMVTLAIFYI